jgi:tRNA(Ile)-lysidine synthase
MSLLECVRRTIRDHELAGPDTRVLVALSGGSDSVALAHIVRELAAEGALHAAGAAHFHHGLRASADRDERFSQAVAESFGWPVVSDREDVGARARRERRSIEDAAHTARYAFFDRARAELHADVVALGHTRDDQAETFLLRLLRGAGPRGLAAMHPRRGTIIRPLIDCRRHELRAYLDERHIPYVEDETNQDVAIARNRVRAELLPLLEARFNPGIVEVLADEADLARGVSDWMEASADALAPEASIPGRESRLELDIDRLLDAPVALRRLIVWRAMTEMARGRPVAFEHVRAVLRLVSEPDKSSRRPALDAPGQRVQRDGRRLVLRSSGPRETAANLFCYPLPVPGNVRLVEAHCVVSAETVSSGAAGTAPVDARAGLGRMTAIVRSDMCRMPLAVRNRRPGDRFRPLGLGGRKKLQDYFVDRKVPRHDRDFVPLVVDGADRIVWVAGHGIDEEFRVTDLTQGVLILKLEQVGGPD